MKTMPKLAHLTMFKDIVHCGSLHDAAKKLAVSQPTLSRVLKELEMSIGARLLERSNRGVRLTAVGELFYRRIDAATNQLLSAFDELRGMSAGGEKRLRVGMSVDPLLCYLPQVLEGFNRRYPHTRVTVVEDGPEGLLARLRNCELDLAVSSLNGAAGGADLAMQALKSERFSLYQGGDLTAAGQPPAEAKWVVVRQQGYIALLSDRVVAHYAPQLHLQKIPTQGIDISARFYVFTRHEPATPPLSAAFIHLLQTLQTG